MKDNTSKNNTLCWSCKKSTTGECSWSKRFIPVKGWKANKNTLRDNKGNRSIISYAVKKCPEFERG